MRLPVKDRATQPYVSEPEIPAVKALLSEWRRLRREEPGNARDCADLAAIVTDPRLLLKTRLRGLAREIALVAALEARLAALAEEGGAPC